MLQNNSVKNALKLLVYVCMYAGVKLFATNRACQAEMVRQLLLAATTD